MASPDKYIPSLDKKGCPPKLEVKLKWKASEWQDRAKAHNADSFATHSASIKDIKEAAKTFTDQAKGGSIALNSDEKALLKYMRDLTADKPVDISIMQTMLKDVCDKTIAIDGQVGDQTVAAMKQAMEGFKNKIPGYREWMAVVSKIDAAMAPVIDLPLVKKLTKPTTNSEWSLRDSTRSISEWSKKLDNLYPLLKKDYPDMGVVIDDHWEISVSWKDKKTWQAIATIETSKKEDII